LLAKPEALGDRVGIADQQNEGQRGKVIVFLQMKLRMPTTVLEPTSLMLAVVTVHRRSASPF
jgi:hypothetical protein